MSVVALILAAALGGAASRQSAAPTPTVTAPPATAVDDIQVEARRQAAYRAARNFIDQAVETPPNRGLARWDWAVCVGVANMRVAVAQPLIDRISDNVASVGLDVGEPGCSPNVLVIATDDGAGTARALVQARPRVFDPGVAGTRLTLRALEQFQSSEAPVRWWRITLPVDSDTGALTVRLRGDDPPVRAIRTSSLLTTQDRNVFARIFIVLDMQKVAGHDLTAIGDYVSMAALSQIDARADVSGYDSILTLFSDTGTTGQMTQWDRDYLTALYGVELNQRRLGGQIGSTASAMAHARQTREIPAD